MIRQNTLSEVMNWRFSFIIEFCASNMESYCKYTWRFHFGSSKRITIPKFYAMKKLCVVRSPVAAKDRLLSFLPALGGLLWESELHREPRQLCSQAWSPEHQCSPSTALCAPLPAPLQEDLLWSLCSKFTEPSHPPEKAQSWQRTHSNMSYDSKDLEQLTFSTNDAGQVWQGKYQGVASHRYGYVTDRSRRHNTRGPVCVPSGF